MSTDEIGSGAGAGAGGKQRWSVVATFGAALCCIATLFFLATHLAVLELAEVTAVHAVLQNARARLHTLQADGISAVHAVNRLEPYGFGAASASHGPDTLHTHAETPPAPAAGSSNGAPPGSKRAKVAYVITITKDGRFGDGAAVLAYSIMKNSQQGVGTQEPLGITALRGSSGSSSSSSSGDSGGGGVAAPDYDISLIALVHPLVKERGVLVKLGYHVIEVPLPINITAIDGKFLREHINNNGCCGATELIKLSSYRLTQYDRVVHMDADTFVNAPLDELFVPAERGGSYDKSLLYSTDPNMATHKVRMCVYLYLCL